MNVEQIFVIVFGLILVGYVVLYINGRKYLETFQNGKMEETFQNPNSMTGQTASDIYPSVPPISIPDISPSSKPGRVVMETTSLDPVAKEAIKSFNCIIY